MVSHRNRTIAQKTARAKEKRERRFSRKKEEKRDPALRAARLEKNKPITLDQKRVWDDVDDGELTSVVDVQALRKRHLEQAQQAEQEIVQPRDEDDNEDDADSMLDFDEDENEQDSDEDKDTATQSRPRQDSLAPSVAPSVASTSNFDITPESLLTRFPSLFSEDSRPPEPKSEQTTHPLDKRSFRHSTVPSKNTTLIYGLVLITTGLDSTLHDVARIFENIIPNSKYVRRSAHKYVSAKHIFGTTSRCLVGYTTQQLK